MKNRWCALLLATLSMSVCGLAGAADLQDLVRDTQRITTPNGQITMVSWFPQQFWDESMKANPAMPLQMRERMVAAMGDYAVFAVARAKVGLGGISDAQPKDELLQNLKVQLNGKDIQPLDPTTISPIAQSLLAGMKPGLASTAGPLGQAMELVVFPARVDGKPVIDATQTGMLQVRLYDQSYQWRLPLGSVLPARKDAKTGEEFPGNYLFNPYTGEKLIAR
jgi:hypothetical protein